MSIAYKSKVNERLIGSPISGESHTIGIVGVFTVAPNVIRLVEVPQGPAPAVTIPGYNEIITPSPTGVQFFVDYATGVITFDASQNGNVVSVSYTGLGSEIAAEDINELQIPVGIALNADGSLSSGIVTTSSINGSVILPRTNLQPLNTSIVPVTDASGYLISSATTVTELGYVHGVTSDIQTQINSITGSGITALTGEVTATGPGSAIATVSSTAAVKSLHADSSPDLTANVQLVSGTNITLNQVGQAITINAAGGGTGITALTGDVTTSSSNPVLLTSATYAVLGATTVTNTGSSVLTGDLGLNPGTSIVGFPPGTFSGTEQIANSFALQAQTDASSAYTTLAALPFTMDLTGQVLGTGGVVPSLVPGVYKFTSTAQLTGTLTLDAGGDPNAQWVFQVGSALTTASSSSAIIINGGSANNVYWLMGTSATLGTTTAFVGTIIATASITANTGASVTGRLLALTGSVTLADNGIIVPAGSGGVEVATLATVNTDVGTFTNATVTTNGKGLITAISNGNVSPSIVAHVSLPGQNTDLGPVTLFTPASTGVYRASVYLATTTADVTAGTVTANMEWTDDAQLETASTSALSLAVLGFTSSTFVIESTSGNPIRYSTTNTGFFNTSFYSIYIVIEKLS